jgi:acylphosphatase
MCDALCVRRVHAIVTGRVQGVSYRASTASEARRLGLVGWVRNLRDGSVELEAEGPDDCIASLLTWCHQGPPAARVSNVDVEECPAIGTESAFAVLVTA